MLCTNHLKLVLGTILFTQILNIQPEFYIPEYSLGLYSNAEDVRVRVIGELEKKKQMAYANSLPKSIIFVGDILLARNVEELMQRKSASYPYSGFSLRRIDPGSYIFGNFEASIPKVHVKTNVNQLNFSVNESYIPAMISSGFTHLSLANNHSNDYGESGFKNTKSVLDKYGAKFFGHSTELTKESVTFIPTKNTNVAVIGIHTLTSVPSHKEIEAIFKYAVSNSDFQIVYIHWGTEYNLKSTKRQRQIAETLVSFGADIIIGHHPHVIQEVGLIKGVPVFYSLGNYIFDQYFSKEVQEGLVLQLEFVDRLNIHIKPVTSIQSKSQPMRMNSKQRKNLLLKLSENGHPELKPSLINGTITIDYIVATSSKIAMINR